MEAVDRDLCALLPWYANGTLNEADMAAYHRHLAGCAVCAAELAQTQAQMREMQSTVDPSLRRLLADRDENYQRLRHAMPRPDRQSFTRAALAMAAGVLVVAAGVAWLAPREEAVMYRGLTAPAVSSDALVVQVMFHPETPERDIRMLLMDTGAELLGNPSPRGVYRIALEPVAEPDRYVQRLRAHPSIAWAEWER